MFQLISPSKLPGLRSEHGLICAPVSLFQQYLQHSGRTGGSSFSRGHDYAQKKDVDMAQSFSHQPSYQCKSLTWVTQVIAAEPVVALWVCSQNIQRYCKGHTFYHGNPCVCYDLGVVYFPVLFSLSEVSN